MTRNIFELIGNTIASTRFRKRAMDALIQRSIKLTESKRKLEVPWQPDESFNQGLHVFGNGQWDSLSLNTAPSTTQEHITKIALYAWNIDFMLPFPTSRMQAAISHLRSLIDNDPAKSSSYSIIFLQECLESDLKFITSDPWVQANFSITDMNANNWASGYYGTISLIDRRLPVRQCFRVHYSKTRMERDVLCTDVLIQNTKTIRFCNTHLESLALEPPYRPPQMELAASWMHREGLSGAILAGDLNAIQDFDKHLHTDNNLKDAYLELGGAEMDPAGHTWGQQTSTNLRERFGTSRMDKAFYCGGVEAKSFERFGTDVLVEDEEERKQIEALGFEKGWITDHLGIKTVFEVTPSVVL